MQTIPSPTGETGYNQKHFSYNRRYVLTMSLIAAMGGLMFGFDLGVITGVIPFIQQQFHLEGFSLGWVVAIFEVGCMGGTFMTAWLSDRLGRKKMLIFTAASFLVTTVGATFSGGPVALAAWRFAQGLGVGAASVLSPMYIAEIAPAPMRGKLVSTNQLSIVTGVLLAIVVSYYVGDPGNMESWRWMFGAALVPALVFFAALFAIPESPRWLVKARFHQQAETVLKKIGNDRFAEQELQEIHRSLQAGSQQGTYAELFGSAVLPILLTGFGLAVLQQFSGANNVTAYMQVIFAKANISIKDGLLNAVFVGLVLFIMTILAVGLVDKMGRRKLMLIGTSCMAVLLFLLAWSFNSTAVNGTLVFAFVMAYIAVYAFTLAPVTWVLLSEIFPNHIRSKALSLASFVLWLATFLVVFISPYLLRLSPVINFILFGICNIIGFVFVLRYVPETKGKTLEELETMLAREKSRDRPASGA
ncbi:sugar porter family MFS transporter [Compostibacter hankyongensis]|uniref:Sugar porter family MFS transporter n=1 Tax=Compostibacter hankyongensis TaxID=1007089 RepID=A0ABP8G189_9BACT